MARSIEAGNPPPRERTNRPRPGSPARLRRLRLRFLLGAAVPALLSSAEKEPLTFRRERGGPGGGGGGGGGGAGGGGYVFKILQLADVHYGEAPGTARGRRQDSRSEDLIRYLVRTERPDLVVLSGDQLTADYIRDGAQEVHARLLGAVRARSGVRWAIAMGNHDDHPYERHRGDGGVRLIDAQATREELLQYDSRLEGSCTVAGPTSTYMIPVFIDDGEKGGNRKEAEPDSRIAAEVYIFDTGGGSVPEVIEQEQVDWFVKVSAKSRSERPVPAVAFQHIASNSDWKFKSQSKCDGTDEEKRVKTVKRDAGLLDAMIEHGDVHFVGVGHNHGKSYCCANRRPLHLCYGRHSGFGGYEKLDGRGARVYELRLTEETSAGSTSTSTFSWKSWVRLADGEIVDQYVPKRVTEYASTTLDQRYRPAVSMIETLEPSSATSASLSISDTARTPTASEVDTSEPNLGITASPSYTGAEQETNSGEPSSLRKEASTANPSAGPMDSDSAASGVSTRLLVIFIYIGVLVCWFKL